MQHSMIRLCAEQLLDETIKLTFDYLSCIDSNGSHGDTNKEEDEGEMMGNSNNILDNTLIFGMNIESWCSSLQTFEYEEDGIEESSYHSLLEDTVIEWYQDTSYHECCFGRRCWYEMYQPTISPYPVTIPVVFTELELFNRDNNVHPKLVRDWKKIHAVGTEEGQMGG